MFMFKEAIASLIFISLTACASQMPGRDAVEISPPASQENEIEVSLDKISDLSSDYYQAYNVSVRNNTGRWLRFDKINIQFPGLAEAPEVLLGSDLQSYSQSIDRRNQIQAYNTRLVLGSIAAAGGIGVITSGGSSTGMKSGAALMAGALTYSAIDDILNSKNRSEFQGALPDSHLLKPFDVGPELVTARWIIVKIPKGTDIDDARIMLTEKGQTTRTFAVEWLTNKPRRVEKKSAKH